MILSIDLLDRNTHGVSWLPLYHDMGLSMIGFPAVYGGHSTLMSPTAFIRRPQRWIHALSAGSRHGRVVTAAPNFAYRVDRSARPARPGDGVDLRNVVMIIGSEPVSIGRDQDLRQGVRALRFAPRSAFKPSYGIAEATCSSRPSSRRTSRPWCYFDREQLAGGQAVPVAPRNPNAVAHVSCGQVARSQWAVIVDPDTGGRAARRPGRRNLVAGPQLGRGYWGRPADTQRTFRAHLHSTPARRQPCRRSEVAGTWLRTGDLGFHLDGELFVIGRIADVVTVDGHSHYPQDIEATAAGASPIIRRGYVAAFTVRR